MDFQKIRKKNKAIDTISQIVQPWPARGEEQLDTAPRPGIVFPTHRQPFPRYHVHQLHVNQATHFPKSSFV